MVVFATKQTPPLYVVWIAIVISIVCAWLVVNYYNKSVKLDLKLKINQDRMAPGQFNSIPVTDALPPIVWGYAHKIPV